MGYLKEEIIKKYGYRLKNLNHITTLNNLETILKYGLLSRVTAINKNLIVNDIASKRLLKVRGGFDRYVPLFLAEGYTTSFYHYQKRWFDVIHIWVKEEVVLLDGVLISNGNLIHSDTKIFPMANIDMLDKVCFESHSYWDIIEDKFTLPAVKVDYNIKSIRASEVLVPGMIPGDYFKGIIYHSSYSTGEKRLEMIKKAKETVGCKVPIYVYKYYGKTPRLVLVGR